ncbi:MAG: hypothetical protein AB7U73_02555 [Pirellulales bacterium]
MGKGLFTSADAWLGGFYEISCEVCPRSDERLRAALLALWTHPDLDGCYEDRNREPADQSRVSPDRLEGGHLLGIARLPNRSRLPCGTCLIREDDGSDWLVFYLPMGSLSKVYPAGGFPFGSEDDWPGPWRFEVEDWLASVGQWVARSASFELGLIGFEVSGDVYAADIAAQGIPATRYMGYLWPSGGSMQYYRRTES